MCNAAMDFAPMPIVIALRTLAFSAPLQLQRRFPEYLLRAAWQHYKLPRNLGCQAQSDPCKSKDQPQPGLHRTGTTVQPQGDDCTAVSVYLHAYLSLPIDNCGQDMGISFTLPPIADA